MSNNAERHKDMLTSWPWPKCASSQYGYSTVTKFDDCTYTWSLFMTHCVQLCEAYLPSRLDLSTSEWRREWDINSLQLNIHYIPVVTYKPRRTDGQTDKRTYIKYNAESAGSI